VEVGTYALLAQSERTEERRRVKKDLKRVKGLHLSICATDAIRCAYLMKLSKDVNACEPQGGAQQTRLRQKHLDVELGTLMDP